MLKVDQTCDPSSSKPPQVVVERIHSEEGLKQALGVRFKVFVEEMGVDADYEVDEYDDVTCAEALHLRAIVEGETVGTLRLVPGDSKLVPCHVCVQPKEGCVGRVSRVGVDPRWQGKGAGQKLMKAIEEEATARGMHTLYLGAVTWRVGFYQRLGWIVEGEEYLEVDLPHMRLVRPLV